MEKQKGYKHIAAWWQVFEWVVWVLVIAAATFAQVQGFSGWKSVQLVILVVSLYLAAVVITGLCAKIAGRLGSPRDAIARILGVKETHKP